MKEWSIHIAVRLTCQIDTVYIVTYFCTPFELSAWQSTLDVITDISSKINSTGETTLELDSHADTCDYAPCQQAHKNLMCLLWC